MRLLQRKLVRELEPVLALPLTSAACLTFLRRHLALPPAQLALLDSALEANAQRLASLEQALTEAQPVRVLSCACKNPDVYVKSLTYNCDAAHGLPFIHCLDGMPC